ncbi:hypothetical protein NG829_00350 [Xanthomonas sacchari]|uniref:hypothetical protein n=1 Tax=Xanthomonas sacchari TaxID=56458 RepID=UPI00225E2345|nr:hypothetical protein [Xanthomonas sacchari]UYK80818.1 hypothetical protein NG829_00350 [Xanthomonas sacchari]
MRRPFGVFPRSIRRFGREPGKAKARANAKQQHDNSTTTARQQHDNSTTTARQQHDNSNSKAIAMATVTGYLLLRKRKRAGGLSPSRPLVPAGAAGVVLRRAAISASAG